jgi:hypothetical protein
MTPELFIAKWRAGTRNARAACQEHFIDLRHLLDEPSPNSDPDGANCAFEKGATTATGGDGWADVWRRECFAWQYKGKHRDRPAAHRQLLNYADALGNPPERVDSVPEFVPGFPDRTLPKNEQAAAILKTRTLTNLCNTRGTPAGAWLDNLHGPRRSRRRRIRLARRPPRPRNPCPKPRPHPRTAERRAMRRRKPPTARCDDGWRFAYPSYAAADVDTLSCCRPPGRHARIRPTRSTAPSPGRSANTRRRNIAVSSWRSVMPAICSYGITSPTHTSMPRFMRRNASGSTSDRRQNMLTWLAV